MLEEGEGQESDFEDIDLDELCEQEEAERRNRSLSGSSANYEEGSFGSITSANAGAKMLKELLLKSEGAGNKDIKEENRKDKLESRREGL